jgi:glycerophosphoryl diester phosphodiesterase
MLNFPKVIAHRGASWDAPENTLPAFDLAIKLGAPAIELDAKLSEDGFVVVHHDPTLERTTNGKGNVWQKSLAELKKLDAGAWKGEQFAKTRIPSLTEVFDLARGKLWVNVELTNYETPHDRLVETVVELVERMKMQEQVFFSSFHPANLRRAYRLQPNIPLSLLTGTFQPPWLAHAWFAPFIPHQARHAENKQISAEFIQKCHARKLKVASYTVNDPAEMRQFLDWGIDGIFTDRPHVALDLLT